ncbi:MAG: redoxin domain-containing protein [Peptostreptococcaceae bacterium]|nr:redoxin domain-containing protein [Peptostreptococcaceae bacterium]
MKKGTLLLIIGLVVLIVGASFGYKELTQRQIEQSANENKQEMQQKEDPVDQKDGSTEEDKKQGSRPANMAPDFTVFDLDEKQVEFSSFEGQPTLINFWASW